ncbi:uncharacterized protein HMPREF1541_07757 [Cyphellophora europaea CBS 101466]|uniref:CUE domain-containing protein n=1 Tax=Cyphellophora europaea (strain CBS 101466) TaxID=1220924 RepID=W2RQY3_CYPE1|nr:uncharacterized protein HMPREF1541_07757 [Cyphellophora europaea CBS 101466]ETN38133.1 hypothetical protein HMPREF1541_07757 [Cyphellophora europaea CBS 101466]
MEEVPGIPHTIPPLVTYPEEKVRASLPPAEWQACLDLWLFSLEFRLRLPDEQFAKLEHSRAASGLDYLKSYVDNHPSPTLVTTSSKEAQVQRRTYLLLKRLLLSTQAIPHLGASSIVDYVIAGSAVFQDLADWPRFVGALTAKYPKQASEGFDKWKASAMKQLDMMKSTARAQEILRCVNALLKVYAEAGVRLMTGSDYLETLIEVYRRHAASAEDQAMQQVLTEHLYLCLRNLMSDKTRHPSLLLDQLYILRSDSNKPGVKTTENRTILAALLCTTSFLRHLAGDAAVVDSKRGADMLDALMTHREQTKHLFPAPVPHRRKAAKGKGKVDAAEELHIHQTSQVSQIHELFPDLPNGYILRLLDHFNDDVEQVTAALLEPASLPGDLQEPSAFTDTPIPQPDLAPRSTPPPLPQRKNVFDNDDFDKFKVSSKQLHKGRRDIKINEPETMEEHSRSKAAIMAALSRFDADDDERDDTYDAADVGGSVDQSVDTDSRPRAEPTLEQSPHEEVLYRAWKDDSSLFARDSKTRISNVRQDLKRQTGMSDEQIEGWAIMLGRDPALQRKMQQKYSVVNTFMGNQKGLEPTRWQQNTSGENSMDEAEGQSSDTANSSGRGGRPFGNRGRGRGTPTFVTPSSGSQQGARSRGRGRGGGRPNHNRREGRARKMGRGMAGAPAGT